jgi:hypothetical protein
MDHIDGFYGLSDQEAFDHDVGFESLFCCALRIENLCLTFDMKIMGLSIADGYASARHAFNCK